MGEQIKSSLLLTVSQHRTIMQTGIHVRKSLVMCVTQLAGG